MKLRRRSVALVFALIAVAAACGGGTPTTSSSSSGPYVADGDESSDPASVARFSADSSFSSPTGSLPPRTFTDLQPIYQPIVEPFGLKLTRAAVIRIKTGPHLQLYVEPSGTAISPQDYVDRVVPLAKAIAPAAFAQYSGINTFDICQEPPPGVDDSPEPPPVTVLFMTRAQVETLDWDSATLKDLRKIVKDMDGGELNADDDIAATSTWKDAEPS